MAIFNTIYHNFW